MPASNRHNKRVERTSNGITALRFFLAAAVVLFHAWRLGGFGPDPTTVLTGGQSRGGGTIAVMGFFGLSGFLLVESRRRTTPALLLWRRALRILPGYWVSIVATAFVIGPWYLTFAWFPGPTVDSAINRSLWTLFPEILCYSILALIPAGALKVVVPGLALGGALLSADLLATGFVGEFIGLFVAFGTGAVLAVAGIRPTRTRAAMLLCVLVVATMQGFWMLAMPFVAAYVALWIGLGLPIHWERDISYGTYIYAHPIGVAVAEAGGAGAGLVPLALMTLGLTVPVAFASWELVERSALTLKNGPRLRGAPAPLPTVLAGAADASGP